MKKKETIKDKPDANKYEIEDYSIDYKAILQSLNSETSTLNQDNESVNIFLKSDDFSQEMVSDDYFDFSIQSVPLQETIDHIYDKTFGITLKLEEEISTKQETADCLPNLKNNYNKKSKSHCIDDGSEAVGIQCAIDSIRRKERRQQKQMLETDEEAVLRRTAENLRIKECRLRRLMRETDEETSIRRAAESQRTREFRQKQQMRETEEERGNRLAELALRRRMRLKNETEEQRDIRRKKNAARRRLRLRQETEEEKTLRRADNARRMAQIRLSLREEVSSNDDLIKKEQL